MQGFYTLTSKKKLHYIDLGGKKSSEMRSKKTSNFEALSKELLLHDNIDSLEDKVKESRENRSHSTRDGDDLFKK